MKSKDIGSCLKFVRVAPLTLRLRLRYAQGERGRVCIRTDSVHEPRKFLLDRKEESYAETYSPY